MGLETSVNWIVDLNPANPTDGDLAKDGDNHIRLIKTALKQSFPNINGAVNPTPAELNKLAGMTATQAELNRLSGVTSPIQTQINDILNLLVPVGLVLPYAGSSAPANTRFLLCQGQAVSRTTYATLFAVIGTTFGAGDGSTTFNLPDLRGVVPRGLDAGRGLDTGRVLGTYQADTLADHTHSGTTGGAGGHSHSYTSFTTAGDTVGTGAATKIGSVFTDTTSSVGNHTHTFTTGSPSTGAAAETRMKNIALNYLIKF